MCVYVAFGGGEGTCTPVPPYGQMPFYVCSLRIDFPLKQVRKQTSLKGNALKASRRRAKSSALLPALNYAACLPRGQQGRRAAKIKQRKPTCSWKLNFCFQRLFFLPVFTQTRATATRLANFLHNGRISNTPATVLEHDYSTTFFFLQVFLRFWQRRGFAKAQAPFCCLCRKFVL